ncbi:MAG: HYR domain-containing protein [Armatimonadota bacterium]
MAIFRVVLASTILMLAGIVLHAQTVPLVAWGQNTSGQCNVPATLADVIAVAGGNWHSLALKADGTVAAWGDNTFGQGSMPAGLSGVQAIAAGNWHNLALKTDGTVFAWGDNSYNQCAVPAGLSEVRAVAAGYMHSLALKEDGTVIGWGSNSAGQRTPPTGLANVVAIAAGMNHSLALKQDGTVVAWGGNGYGQRTVPAGLTGVVAIDTMGYHNLALKSDGTVLAWGRNEAGQCNVPAGLAGVTAIAAGGSHSLALKSDGTAVAWGLNTSGQCTIPAVPGPMLAVAAGYFHNLTLVLPSVVQSNAPPVADAGTDQVTEATGPLTTVYLSGSASSDPDGDILAFEWKDGSSTVLGNTAGVAVERSVSTTAYTLTVTDEDGLTAADTVTVTVQDTTPPVITVPESVMGYVSCASGTVLNFSVTAVDLVDGTVPVDCTPPSGDMFPIGRSEVTCVAADLAGNQATTSFPAYVIYEWSGLDFPGKKTEFKAGSGVALRFLLTSASAGLTDCHATLGYARDMDGPFQPAASFHYDAESGQYVCTWKTKGLAAGEYWLQVDLGDDWPHVYSITLR